jgi:hypothetical protein
MHNMQFWQQFCRFLLKVGEKKVCTCMTFMSSAKNSEIGKTTY